MISHGARTGQSATTLLLVPIPVPSTLTATSFPVQRHVKKPNAFSHHNTLRIATRPVPPSPVPIRNATRESCTAVCPTSVRIRRIQIVPSHAHRTANKFTSTFLPPFRSHATSHVVRYPSHVMLPCKTPCLPAQSVLRRRTLPTRCTLLRACTFNPSSRLQPVRLFRMQHPPILGTCPRSMRSTPLLHLPRDISTDMLAQFRPATKTSKTRYTAVKAVLSSSQDVRSDFLDARPGFPRLVAKLPARFVQRLHLHSLSRPIINVCPKPLDGAIPDSTTARRVCTARKLGLQMAG